MSNRTRRRWRRTAVKTIKWQGIQIRLVGDISDHLISKGLIFYNADEEIAERALAGHIDKIVVPIINRFNEVPEIAGLQSPPWDEGYIDVFFQDAYQLFSSGSFIQPASPAGSL